MLAFLEELEKAGFVEATFLLFGDDVGYWNEETGEFLFLYYGNDTEPGQYYIGVDLYFIGVINRQYVTPVEPEEPATPTPTVTATPTETPAGE